ncbi:hypothetical protein [Rhizobium sp.]
MSKWLQGLWISPSEHQEIVEELRGRIKQLEKDFVEVAQSLINETEARRRAEYVRNDLMRLRESNAVRDGNIILLNPRNKG